MKTFRDNAGREWAITVDLPTASRVMKSKIEFEGEPVKVNLLALIDPKSGLTEKMVHDPTMIANIAYAMIQPQAVEKNVSDEDFGRALDVEVIERIYDCIMEEAIDFFCKGPKQASKKKALQKMLEKSRAFAEKARTLAEGRIETGELDRAIDEVLEAEWRKLQAPLTTGTGTVGNSSASPASTPPSAP